MCGRFGLTRSPDRLIGRLVGHLGRLPDDVAHPRFNIAPTQRVLAVVNEDPPTVMRLRWGLVPPWSVTPDAGRLSTFNARIETLARSRLYGEATRHRRCVIVADGFYEWARDEYGAKTPFWIHRRDGEAFGFAGLWERWTSRSLDEHVTSCTIVTAPANAFMAPVHNRMPVVLDDERARAWLTHEPLDGGATLDILIPAENASTWTMDEVSRRVGNVRNDDPSLVEPVIHGSTDGAVLGKTSTRAST